MTRYDLTKPGQKPDCNPLIFVFPSETSILPTTKAQLRGLVI